MVLLGIGCAQSSSGTLDSDGDGIPDSLESSGDTDGDGLPNYLDRDSDNDLLADGVEDGNHNGVVDAGESSPIKADTDGDGVGDMLETALQPAGQHWATDPTKTPAKAGIYSFVVPYSSNGSKAPIPTSSLV
ncbi:MAG TPA: hypothetical protein VMV03_02400, partial [Spirochaetia bacterium]|nr:hypothetical protein [Spirochaetia bacterium]